MTPSTRLAELRAALVREADALRADDEAVRALPLAERAAMGAALYPLSIEATELRSRRRVNVVLRGNHLHDGLQPGDPIRLGRVGKPDVGLAGRVESRDVQAVELRVDEVPDGVGPWAITRRLDLSLLDLQRAALERAERLNTPLVNLLLGHEKPYRADPYPHPAFARLDPGQREAAELVLGATEIGLLHGPPGTGKTDTLVAILAALRDLGERPWALADTNPAVDHLALRARAAGLDVVRLGLGARVGGPARALTLEHRILHGARAEVIRTLMRDASRVTGDDGLALRDAIREEWSAAKREILASADVLAMTLRTLHTRGHDLPSPRTAVVDDANQVTEPAVWLLATRVKRVFLAGDPQALGPLVRGREPLLARSLLARAVDAGFPFPMLRQQYRMNEELLALCAPAYDGRLCAHPSVAEPVERPAARWIDTAGMGLDEEADGRGSWHNPGELRLVRIVLDELAARGVARDRIAILAPYHGQVARIRKLWPDVEAGTVLELQGRETDNVIASLVRSNPDQALGDVADGGRRTVMLSRARHRFIGIGDTGTLGVDPRWQGVIDTIAAQGGYRSGWEYDLG